MGSRTTFAAAVLCAAMLALPAVAGAATVTATNDAGQPVQLSEGTPLSVRQMAPVVTPSFTASEKRYTLRITGPDGKSASLGIVCGATSNTQPADKITYAGNGNYAIQLLAYPDENDISCEGTPTTQNFSVTISASVTLTGPKSPLLYRPAGGSIITQPFHYDLNPGAASYEIVWAYDAKLGANGAIVGEYNNTDFQDRTASIPNGTWEIDFPHSGLVTIVAAAQASNSISPFSAPLVLKLMGPFDWSSTPSWTDGRGPSYTIGGEIAEPRIVGQKVSVLMAKGSGKFKPLKTLTIPASRKFTVRFKQKKTGKFRFKYVFKGSEYVAAGAYLQTARLKRSSASISSPVPVAR